MRIFTSDTRLSWGELDLPLLGITSDWYGKTISPAIGFTIATDPESLWFVATRQAPATPLPGSEPGVFTPQLWEWDVAEFFVTDRSGSKYLEFNIAPNGAWWASKLSAPRVPSLEQPDFAAQIQSFSDDSDPGSWVVALRIPLALLKEQIEFEPGCRGNATFIMNSPANTFLSVAPLPGREPDFHQPSAFPKLIPCKLPTL